MHGCFSFIEGHVPGLFPKVYAYVHLSPLKSAINVVARVIAHIPLLLLHICPHVWNNHTGFLSLCSLNSKSLFWSQRHNRVLSETCIWCNTLVFLHHPLDLPHTRSAIAQSWSFASIDPFLCNALFLPTDWAIADLVCFLLAFKV